MDATKATAAAPPDLSKYITLDDRGFAIYHGPVPMEALPFPDVPAEQTAAWEWADRQLELRRQFGGLAWAVANSRLWGVGKTYAAALADARQLPDCPADEDLIIVVPSGLSTDEKAALAGEAPR